MIKFKKIIKKIQNGIYKSDIGIKNGLIHKIGKSGNPDTQPNIDIIIGPGTEIIAGEGKIITAKAPRPSSEDVRKFIDSHLDKPKIMKFASS